MTKIQYTRKGRHHRLHVSGHAGYAKRGEDIVCAGISALSFALLGYLQSMGVDMDEETVGEGVFRVSCQGDRETAAAFSMALTGYLQLEKQYPQNVEVHISADGG